MRLQYSALLALVVLPDMVLPGCLCCLTLCLRLLCAAGALTNEDIAIVQKLREFYVSANPPNVEKAEGLYRKHGRNVWFQLEAKYPGRAQPFIDVSWNHTHHHTAPSTHTHTHTHSHIQHMHTHTMRHATTLHHTMSYWWLAVGVIASAPCVQQLRSMGIAINPASATGAAPAMAQPAPAAWPPSLATDSGADDVVGTRSTSRHWWVLNARARVCLVSRCSLNVRILRARVVPSPALSFTA